MNLIPFGNRGDCSHKQKHKIKVSYCLYQGDYKRIKLRRVVYDSYRNGNNIDRNAEQSQKHCRHNRHKHIKARKAAFEYTLNQLCAIILEHLIKTFCPSESLCIRLMQCCRLFIIKDCVCTISYLFALNDAVGCKLNILGQKMVNPSVVFADNIGAYQKSRTRNGTACIELHSRVVKITCLSQKPKRISCGNPVSIIVL